MPETNNPLRYPGAKRMLADYVDELLEANHLWGCNFFEPYAGSAAVGLELLRRNHIGRLILCEKDILLYAFWESVFRNPVALCARINETPITLENWHRLNVYRKVTSFNQDELLNLGFAGLFFNRTNFSGILNANPIGGISQSSKYDISCRFNKTKVIDSIRELSRFSDLVEVHYGDALQFMRTQSRFFLRDTCFSYFDPPYYEKGSKIYRHFYTQLDHVALAQYATNVRHLDWLVSYDDAPFICGLYGDTGAQYQPLFLDYTCASKVRKHGQELLISNLPLPPFPVANAINV
jgi:DNA adenine methylase